jgi:hypothetical protein
MSLRGDLIEKNDYASSMNEAILRNEITRLRNTYSFKLGLMLTDAFFRKPWQIPFLPFKFLKLNLDFILKKGRETGTSFNSYERDEKSLMLFVASEGGKAACDRAMQIARDWLAGSGHHIVIISSNTGMIGFDEPNMSLYMLPDPKSSRIVSKKGWNLSCENVLYRAIHSHAPSTFVFDGPYPYRGILNAIKSVQEMDTVWIASERTEKEILNRCERNFNNVFHQNYSGDSYISRNSRKRHYSSLTNKILVATNYGSHNSAVSIPPNVNHALSKYNNLSLVGINHTYKHDQVSEDFSELLDGYEDKKRISSLQGAIVSDNLELIAQLHHNMVPTVCILHEKTNANIKNEIQKMALLGGLFVSSWDEKDEIELYIDAIVNRDWNLAITQNGTPKSARILNGLIK